MGKCGTWSENHGGHTGSWIWITGPSKDKILRYCVGYFAVSLAWPESKLYGTQQ